VEIIDKISQAFRRLLSKDAPLFIADVNERSMTHRFAMYLQDEFPEYDVDCEYNRNGLAPKRLENFKESIDSDDSNGVTVYPDIIVHHRRLNDNYIVIEAKKTSSTRGDDLEKLKAYKTELSYKYAYFVRFPVAATFDGYNDSSASQYIQEIK
jgi:hypothetical protein